MGMPEEEDEVVALVGEDEDEAGMALINSKETRINKGRREVQPTLHAFAAIRPDITQLTAPIDYLSSKKGLRTRMMVRRRLII